MFLLSGIVNDCWALKYTDVIDTLFKMLRTLGTLHTKQGSNAFRVGEYRFAENSKKGTIPIEKQSWGNSLYSALPTSRYISLLDNTTES